MKAQGLLRRFRSTAGAQIDGRERLQFGSNNYLGLSTHPRVVEASIRAAQQYGAGSTGSRLLSGNHPLNEALERELADFKQTEDAVVFSSGCAANIGAIPRLFGACDLILSDALNHASLIDGCRLSKADRRIYPHGDAEAAEQLLRQERGRADSRRSSRTAFSALTATSLLCRRCWKRRNGMAPLSIWTTRMGSASWARADGERRSILTYRKTGR